MNFFRVASAGLCEEEGYGDRERVRVRVCVRIN
jgi:hypothetical protein